MVSFIKKNSFFWEFIKILFISIIVIIPIRYFIAQPFFVKGESMVPGFEDGEYLIIDELSYFLRGPERGEVVVFKYPIDPSQYYIKRIIGLPGETVLIKNGQVFVKKENNGPSKLLDESLYLNPASKTTPDLEVNLRQGEYFVMGDNREFSYDSRRFGPLPEKYLVGKALLRLFPPTRLQIFKPLNLPI